MKNLALAAGLGTFIGAALAMLILAFSGMLDHPQTDAEGAFALGLMTQVCVEEGEGATFEGCLARWATGDAFWQAQIPRDAAPFRALARRLDLAFGLASGL